jgi:phospholipid/cholesterol/gamma-HCH transport system substrate-binding protein
VKDNLAGAAWRLTGFVVVCATALFALFAVFGQLRFDAERTYEAEFTNVSGLKSGDFVRIAGVEVGKIKDISIRRDAVALVTFSADDSVMLTQGTRAAIRYENLIGGRYLALEEGAGGVARLTPGQTIPLARTAPALDLDALIGGFRPLFRALDPDQVNALSGQLVAVFQGQGQTIGSFLDQTASLTSALADRDDVIGQVITNLNVVLGSLSEHSDQLGKTVDSLAQLVNGLEGRKDDISNAVGYGNAAAGSIADLLVQARPPLQNTVHQTGRVAGLVAADGAYVDNLLKTLPDTYRVLARQGMYGDFFSFYLCDAVLKVNGKGGQPVYIKLAGQDSGRCTPK